MRISGGGTVGVVSRTVAVFARKGTCLHRPAGNVFFVSMLIMLAIWASVALLMPGGVTNVVGGTLTFYLVATTCMTIRRMEGTVGRLETIARVAALDYRPPAEFEANLPPYEATAQRPHTAPTQTRP